MAKTYNSIPSVATGDVYTAAAHNAIATNVNNYRVPPMCLVYRSSDLSGYTSDADITWNAESYDTDEMFTPSGTTITIGTAGLYLVSFYVYFVGLATITNVSMRIRVNGATAMTHFGATGSTGVYSTAALTLSLAASDTVAARVGVAGGSSYSVAGNADPRNQNASRLSLTWLGQVS